MEGENSKTYMFGGDGGYLPLLVSMFNQRGIDPFSEEFQYLNGIIGKQMFKAGKMFLCEHCRAKLLERE